MFAVVKTGAKQFRVAPGDVIKVEKLEGAAGDTVTLGEVLMLGGDSPEVGAPTVSGASVAAEILEQARDKKVVVFKKRRRQNYRRKKGHRQHMTVLRIDEILTGGAKPTGAKAAKPAPAKQEASAEAAPAGDAPTDVSLIAGVGPKLKAKMAENGIESLAQLAAMDDATKQKLDDADLLARAEREEWQEQAKELMAGKAPRAKVDQKAQSGE
ncbi:50S ribosomal protein L21 [Parvularcula dongshanensis]|uniref:Large ribosomal subunit protein bL21 n=1 Tax=Parvularcula dongshanensis TaxID=1173995 RepID=A0A840I536_9PROT|nr:large subunit ribosomal protein L21 [Parvularcula dongshanensis]